MAQYLKPVVALLMSAAILLAGNGLANVLIPIRADLEGFSRLEIGLMGSAYYAGLMAGCVLSPGIIGRVGHIRAFVAFTAIVSIAPLAQAIWPVAAKWWALRALMGLCFAGLLLVIESWLNGMATAENRGRVLSTYTFINLTVVTLGQQLIALTDPKGFELFSLVAILYSLAAVPVALTTTSQPQAPRQAKLRLAWLFSVSPAAVLGCFFTGLANSGFWSLAPIFAREAGLSVRQIALFISVAVLGGALLQWPIGYLSDRWGRRLLAAIAAIGAAAAGLGQFLAARAGAPSTELVLAISALYGAMAFPIYTLCVAHANDLVHRKRAVEVSSGLLLTFSTGAIIGPAIASMAMQSMGYGGLFLYSAAAHLMIAFVMVLRARQRPKPPVERNERFVPVPKTTPAIFDLDPRGEQENEKGEGEKGVPPPAAVETR